MELVHGRDWNLANNQSFLLNEMPWRVLLSRGCYPKRMPSIGVLEHNQKPTERPSRRIKKAGGQSLVNRGMAFWLIENVLLKMIDVQKLDNRFFAAGTVDSPRRTYIPDHLPWNIDKMLGVIVVGIPRNVRNPWEIQP